MARRKAARYEFRTIQDLHAIPLDKIEPFIHDLRTYLMMSRAVEMGGAVVRNPDVFAWIDDGKHDVSVTLHLRAEREKGGD